MVTVSYLRSVSFSMRYRALFSKKNNLCSVGQNWLPHLLQSLQEVDGVVGAG